MSLADRSFDSDGNCVCVCVLESDSMISTVRIRFDEIAQFEMTIFFFILRVPLQPYLLQIISKANHLQRLPLHSGPYVPR